MQKYLQSVCLDKGKSSMLSDLSILWSVFGYKYVVHINPSGKYSTVLRVWIHTEMCYYLPKLDLKK